MWPLIADNPVTQNSGSFLKWLMDHEGIGVWVEAAALILIFGLDSIERVVSSKEHKRQHEATQKQLLHSEEQAKASMLSAKAVINTERPWLVVAWWTDKHVAGLFRFGCRNHGNTPATVVSVSARNLPQSGRIGWICSANKNS
jgi:hypothetical protein